MCVCFCVRAYLCRENARGEEVGAGDRQTDRQTDRERGERREGERDGERFERVHVSMKIGGRRGGVGGDKAV